MVCSGLRPKLFVGWIFRLECGLELSALRRRGDEGLLETLAVAKPVGAVDLEDFREEQGLGPSVKTVVVLLEDLREEQGLGEALLPERSSGELFMRRSDGLLVRRGLCPFSSSLPEMNRHVYH